MKWYHLEFKSYHVSVLVPDDGDITLELSDITLMGPWYRWYHLGFKKNHLEGLGDITLEFSDITLMVYVISIWNESEFTLKTLSHITLKLIDIILKV